jgi:hypothetical protein
VLDAGPVCSFLKETKTMNVRILITTLAPLGAALALALTPACGGDDSGGGNGSEDDSGSTSGSSSSCSGSFDCVGGSCECTTSGKEGQSCCDPDDCGSDSNNCDDVCEVCS